MRYKISKTIEEFLRSRQKHPVASLELMKDMARRIKAVERKINQLKK